MKLCLNGRAPEVRVGEDHISACWMNIREGMEKNVVEYAEDGSIARINLDGGEEA